MKSRISLLMIFTVVITTAIFLPGFINKKSDMVKHIVIFKYKQGSSEEKIKQVTDAFRTLKSKIPGIVSFETGVNNSPEKLNKGFTHVYLVTFENEKARNEYLPHPEHKKFGELLGNLGVLEEAFVVDFMPEN
jgi:hypothetical protein